MMRRNYEIVSESSNPTSDSKELILKIISNFKDIGIQDDAKWLEGYMQFCADRLAFDLDIIKKYVPKNTTICEYGAAPFIFTKALETCGYNVYGVDIAPERFILLEKLKLEISKVNFERETLPFKDDCFDFIAFNELFEHLRIDILFTLKEVARILKKNGFLMISTPNLRSTLGCVNFLLNDKSWSCAGDLHLEWSKISKIGHMGHVREYTTTEVCEFIEKMGFRIRTVIYRGRLSPLSWKRKILSKIELLIPSLRPMISIIAQKK